MKSAVITLLTVFALVSANIIGIFLFSAQEEINFSSDEMVDDHEVSNIEAQENELHSSTPSFENGGVGEKIDWHLLPQDRNPSAKLFLDEQVICIEFRLPEMTIERSEEGDIVNLEDCDFLFEPGKPLVPESRFFIAVPKGSKVKNVEIVEEKMHELESNHIIAPFIPRTLDGERLPVSQDPEVYSSDDPFPSSSYEIHGPDKLRHLDAIEVILYPVKVRPASGTVEVFDMIRLCIELEKDQGGKITPPSIPAYDSLDNAILDLIVNPEDMRFSGSFEPPEAQGTRAPSTIFHTLGFHGSASGIHPLKDTTVGNIGGVALLEENDDNYYIAEAGKTMYVDGFDIGTANPLANLEYAMLHLQYNGTNGYNGASKVRWALEGNSLQDTTTQPTDLGDNESADLSYDLLGHSGSPSTVNDLADLDIEFSENGTGGGSKDIPFDYIWIEFAYREELTGDSDYLIITNLQMADELRPLAEWKTDRLNIDTQVYDIEWIDANCDGANTLHRTYDFIRSMFLNYSIEWILLGGDETVIPTNTSSHSYDAFYANVVGFVYPDIAIGRLPTTQDSIMEGMVNDILAHQRDMRPWKSNMYLIGTNVFNIGDGRRDMEYIKENYLEGHDKI
ncbi:MAG: C25 family cysteine peptidase [Candidatus Hodarchaeota archaeon]